MRELKFVNSDAKPKTQVLNVGTEAIELLMCWYGTHYAGDRYAVYVDGVKVKTDQNGDLVGDLPEAVQRPRQNVDRSI